MKMLKKIEILLVLLIYLKNDEDAEENRDTVSIVNLLKENLDMWKSEEEGADN